MQFWLLLSKAAFLLAILRYPNTHILIGRQLGQAAEQADVILTEAFLNPCEHNDFLMKTRHKCQ
jgi:hypothetical protein